MPDADAAEPRALEADLHWLAVRLARGLGAEMERVVADHGLALRPYVVLTAIAANPGSTQLQIAQRSGIDKSVLVGLLDDLERRDLITRASDPSDRRARLLEPTEEGLRLLRAATGAVVEAEHRTLGTVEPTDRETFLRVLAQVAGTRLAAPTGPIDC